MASSTDKNNNGRGRRIIASVLIGGLLLAGALVPLFLEYRARAQHETSVVKLEKALKQGGVVSNLTQAMAELLIEGNPRRLTTNVDGKRQELFEWNGVVGRYVVVLRVDPKRDLVVSISTEVARFDELAATSTIAAKSETANTANSTKSKTPNTANAANTSNTAIPVKSSLAISRLMKVTDNDLNIDLFSNPPSQLTMVPQELSGKVDGVLQARAWQRFPKPVKTDLKLELEFEQRMLRKMTIDAFKTYGSHDPAWDDQVLAFLESYLAQHTKEVTEPDIKLVEKARDIVDSGCDDPNVLSIVGRLFHENGEFEQAVALLSRIEATTNPSKYPARLRLGARISSLKLLSARRVPRALTLHIRLMGVPDFALITGTIEAKDWDNDSRRYHLMQIDELLRLLNPNYLQLVGTVLNGMRAPGDDWVWKMALSRVHFLHAWHASRSRRRRSQDQERVFYTHLEVSRRLALEAWAQRPDLCQAAVQLIATNTTIGDVTSEPKRF